MSKTITKENDLQRTPSIKNTLESRGYQLLAKIGEGAYASVFVTQYQPTPDSPKKNLACKILDTRKIPKQFAKKFLPRELDVLGKVEHQNIIKVHSIFAHNTKYFIFMYLAQKGDLLNFIVKNGAVSEQQSFKWFRQITLAVQYLHNMKIAHRDLKCENLLIDTKHNIMLSDFGFARSFVDETGDLVKSKTYCGSVSYASPEILSGTPYDPVYADMWSMGVILFVMLNKAVPFEDTNVKRIHESQIQRNWRFRPKVTGYLSDDVRQVVKSLLEPDVKARWATQDIIDSTWFIVNFTRTLVMEKSEDQNSDNKDLENDPDPETIKSSSTADQIQKKENSNIKK